jgi:hypothetical protein
MVGCQQGGIEICALTLLLRQQMIVVLENAMLNGVLNFGGQAAFAVKALNVGLLIWRACVLSIKGIVAVATQYGFRGVKLASTELRARSMKQDI